jgi:hypothetical protein
MGKREPIVSNRLKKRSNAGHITEFPLSLYILLLIVVFPIVDLVGLVTGSAIICLTAHQAASRAANQRRYADSLDVMQQSANDFLKTGFAEFARLHPTGGFGNCGANLYIDACNYQTNAIQAYGPNTPLPPPADTSTYVYECRVQTAYEVGPTVDLSFMPGLSAVPGLGKPAVINFSASRDAEYPTGLAAALPPPPNGAVPPYNAAPTIPQTGPLAGPEGSGWNHPSIYEEIKAAGQHVVTEDVILVQANNYNWTATGITVASGQTLWIDLRSDGSWTSGTGMFNANGNPADKSWTGPMPGQPEGMLLGKVGSAAAFAVGTTYQNYAPGQAGPFSLIFNDDAPPTYTDNVGTQMVRVIVTQ